MAEFMMLLVSSGEDIIFVTLSMFRIIIVFKYIILFEISKRINMKFEITALKKSLIVQLHDENGGIL